MTFATPTRPVLRYFGGKWQLASWIISYLPEHRIYVEPYSGAASVLLRKPRSYSEIYNDLHGEVVNLFRVLRNPAQARELIRLVTLTPYSREEYEQSYITDGDPIEQARRTLVQSWMGFNGAALRWKTGFRSGIRCSGSTHAQDWRNFPSALEQIAERLRGVTIENRPAVDVIADYDSAATLFYVDPPYVHGTRNVRSTHYRYEMTDDDHRELAGVLRSATGKVVISGYACPLYDEELYPDWQRAERSTHAGGAHDRVEVLWISPSAVRQPTLFQEEQP